MYARHSQSTKTPDGQRQQEKGKWGSRSPSVLQRDSPPSYDFEYTLMEETRESEQTLPTFTYNTATTYANEQQRHEDDGDDSGIYIIIVNIETAANLAQQTKFGHLYKQPKQPRKIGKNNISFK